MSIYGYNFNACSSGAYVKALYGFYSVCTTIDSGSDLSWLSRHATSYGKDMVSPPLPSAVAAVRAKINISVENSVQDKSLLQFLDEDVSLQINIVRESTGELSLYRGTTLLATTSSASLVPWSTAVNIEAYVTIDSTDGSVTVLVNGVVIDDLTFTGNTQNTDNANIRYCGVGSSNYCFINDLIIDDDPTDTIIGNCYVKTRTIASVSSNTGFTAEGDETDIPTILNQTSPDGTDYIEASADGDTITLALEAGDDADEDIRAIQMTALVQKNGDGDCNGTLSATVNGTTTSGDETALSNGYTGLSLNITGTISKAVADAATITLTRSE